MAKVPGRRQKQVIIDDDDHHHYTIETAPLAQRHISIADSSDSESDATLHSPDDETTTDTTDYSDYHPSPPPPWVIEDSYLSVSTIAEAVLLKDGDTVELAAPFDKATDHRGDFLRIRRIIRSLETDNVILQGWRFRRNHHFSGMLPLKVNECCMTVSVIGNATECSFLDLGTESVPATQVLRKRKLIITNCPFPQQSYRENAVFVTNPEDPECVRKEIEQRYELTARWLHVAYYATVEDKQKGRTSECLLRRFKHSELQQILPRREHEKTTLEDKRLQEEWLGRQLIGNQLTFGDAFCGAGGVSQGARMGGIDVLWGCDNDERTCQAYACNLPASVNTFSSNVQDLIALEDSLTVDILHISPPCQAFSPANSLVRYRHHLSEGGQRDERNQAALFCVPLLLKKVRPRVTTVEETSGLLTHHGEYLPALISNFTNEDFSIRWRLMNFADFGLCQQRKRLMIIASCPGGVLPCFPEKTHGTASQAYTTISDAIGSIPAGAPDHHVGQTINAMPYDAHTQLKGLIATGGTTATHPSGSRRFTVREQACMQGFPMDFKFPQNLSKGDKLRLIGNAVPPIVAKELFESVKRALLEEDAALANH
ncbi:MAG: hypothetical protein M1828_004533 [Chrysothrix sp. TS-e1954]|nr:MAG: hypothetical protein M1828_004533 [Chrysothrix sp. TS-e1954]